MREIPNADLPDSTKLNGLCTRCAEQSTFVVEHYHDIGYRDYTIDGTTPIPGERVVILLCNRCQERMVVIEKSGRRQYPEQPIEANISDEVARATPKMQNAEVVWWGVQWWPLPD